MIFMDIVSWEPKDSEAVGKCYEGYEYPEGVKVIDEWIDLSGYRFFVIYELEDEKAYMASNLPFMGLCRFETIPVMRADIYMEAFRKIAEKAGVEPERKKDPDALKHLEGLEKRVKRLEQQTFIQQEDVT